MKHDILKLDDDFYPIVSMNINHTHEQMTALFRKWKQWAVHDDDAPRWTDFAKTAQSTFHMDGAIAIEWRGIWLAIETDGYTHS